MQARTLDMPLVSNGYNLSVKPQRLGWLNPTDPKLPMSRLRSLYQEQGYLWLKGILNRDEVLDFRRYFFEAFQDTGLLARGSNPVDGIYAGGSENKERVHKIFVDCVRWPSYESFCTLPHIWKFYKAFLGGEPYLHKRKLMRYNLPGEAGCTGGHYDLIYLRAGTDRLCSSWIPIGDTPVEMGGLLYLENSDALGRKMEAEFSARNSDLPTEQRISAYNRNMRTNGWLSSDLPNMAEKFNSRWLMADYEAGDMVVHSPYLIHGATVNRDPQQRIRLSTDIRYQLISDTIDPRWSSDWHPDDNH